MTIIKNNIACSQYHIPPSNNDINSNNTNNNFSESSSYYEEKNHYKYSNNMKSNDIMNIDVIHSKKISNDDKVISPHPHRTQEFRKNFS